MKKIIVLVVLFLINMWLVNADNNYSNKRWYVTSFDWKSSAYIMDNEKETIVFKDWKEYYKIKKNDYNTKKELDTKLLYSWITDLVYLPNWWITFTLIWHRWYHEILTKIINKEKIKKFTEIENEFFCKDYEFTLVDEYNKRKYKYINSKLVWTYNFYSEESIQFRNSEFKNKCKLEMLNNKKKLDSKQKIENIENKIIKEEKTKLTIKEKFLVKKSIKKEIDLYKKSYYDKNWKLKSIIVKKLKSKISEKKALITVLKIDSIYDKKLKTIFTRKEMPTKEEIKKVALYSTIINLITDLFPDNFEIQLLSNPDEAFNIFLKD